MEPSSVKKKIRLSKYCVCPHCNNELSLKKFKEHKRLFYDHQTKRWDKDVSDVSSEAETSEFSEIEDVTDTISESEWDNVLKREPRV